LIPQVYTIINLLLIFVLGLFIGSFLNVLVDRIPKNESIVFPPSRCDNCKKHIPWYDLIPVLSFIMLCGKCRFCKTKLSYYYPVIEITTGILFALTFFFVIQPSATSLQQLAFSFIYFLFITSCLIVIFFTDLKSGIIPDKILVVATVATVVWLLFHNSLFMIHDSSFIINRLLAAAGAFIFFLAIYLLTRGRGMGFGDVKLSFFLGLLLGFPGIFITLYIGFLTGAFVGVILIIWRKKKLRGSTIPFGPFLVLGSLVVFFWGNFLISKLLFLF
jgi:prepilin signal peptidase PulO-like enzyme (type II secretory pathway)